MVFESSKACVSLLYFLKVLSERLSRVFGNSGVKPTVPETHFFPPPFLFFERLTCVFFPSSCNSTRSASASISASASKISSKLYTYTYMYILYIYIYTYVYLYICMFAFSISSER